LATRLLAILLGLGNGCHALLNSDAQNTFGGIIWIATIIGLNIAATKIFSEEE